MLGQKASLTLMLMLKLKPLFREQSSSSRTISKPVVKRKMTRKKEPPKNHRWNTT
jgi:hypothetical protein